MFWQNRIPDWIPQRFLNYDSYLVTNVMQSTTHHISKYSKQTCLIGQMGEVPGEAHVVLTTQ